MVVSVVVMVVVVVKVMGVGFVVAAAKKVVMMFGFSRSELSLTRRNLAKLKGPKTNGAERRKTGEKTQFRRRRR